jgi:hypothetical protein
MSVPTVKQLKEQAERLYQDYLAAINTVDEDSAYVEYAFAWRSYWIAWHVNPEQRKGTA